MGTRVSWRGAATHGTLWYRTGGAGRDRHKWSGSSTRKSLVPKSAFSKRGLVPDLLGTKIGYQKVRKNASNGQACRDLPRILTILNVSQAKSREASCVSGRAWTRSERKSRGRPRDRQGLTRAGHPRCSPTFDDGKAPQRRKSVTAETRRFQFVVSRPISKCDCIVCFGARAASASAGAVHRESVQ